MACQCGKVGGSRAGRTLGYYLSRCRTFLPILLAAAATMDSVIPVGNHDSKQCWVNGENSPRPSTTRGIVLIKINTCAYNDHIVLGRQIVLHDCLLPQLSHGLDETDSRQSSALARVQLHTSRTTSRSVSADQFIFLGCWIPVSKFA